MISLQSRADKGRVRDEEQRRRGARRTYCQDEGLNKVGAMLDEKDNG